MRITRRGLLAASIAGAIPRPGGAQSLPVTAAGAVADGKTLNTAAIQKAIDQAGQQGGGTVTFPAGVYVTGTLELRSGVTVRLEDGATLLGSTSLADYRCLADGFTDGRGAPMGYCLISASGVSNVAIEGLGAIDGRGREVLAARGPEQRDIRPLLMRFTGSTGVRLDGIHLRDAAAWMVHFFQCRKITADAVTISSHAGANNDGFDIDSCESVRIRNCDIDTGDDAVCLKTTSPAPCRDVVVSGCTLKSNCAAFKIGTESLGDFEDVRVSDCSIPRARLAAVKILSVDGANVRNIDIRNLTMDSGAAPVFLRLGARLKTFRAGDAPRQPGTMRNISVRDLTATADAPGVLISGIPGHMIEDVTMEEVRLRLPGGGTDEDARAVLPEAPADYPEIRMFGPRMPCYGAYVRHARRVSVRDLKIALAAADARPETALVDAEDVTFPGLETQTGAGVR
jgi:polygalacturonase